LIASPWQPDGISSEFSLSLDLRPQLARLFIGQRPPIDESRTEKNKVPKTIDYRCPFGYEPILFRAIIYQNFNSASGLLFH
jgi:hypothetical protein